MGYGGLAILDTQDGLDYQDNHFYIDHYNFPNTAWDGFDWRIRDSAAADDGWSAFTNMAWARQAGRPYTVSEYNQPWPNTHAAEIAPSLAAYAAFQEKNPHADVTLYDGKLEPATILSRKVVMTIVDGKVVYEAK